VVNPNDITITREEIYTWISEARQRKVNIREYVREQLENDLRASGVDVQIGDDVRSVVDHILDDLDSYV
jgi:hypothetical protein